MSVLDEPSPWIVNGTEENFESLVERSKELPVIVDFWATWCQPCLQLAPILEGLVLEADGKLLLVKVNVDEQQGLAMAFGVQSIPHLFVLKDGQAIDQLPGALPEAQLRQWLEQFQPSEIEQLLLDGQKLEATDTSAAEEKYRDALERDPNSDAARLRLAKLYLNQHRNAECREYLSKLEQRGFLEPEAEAIKAELELRESAADSGDLAQLRAAVAKDPANLEAKLQLADALAVAHQYAEALEFCLELVQGSTGELREKARQTMVNMFQMIGPESDLTRTYRRKLATALY